MVVIENLSFSFCQDDIAEFFKNFLNFKLFCSRKVPRTGNCILLNLKGRVWPTVSFGGSGSMLIIDVYEMTGLVVPGCKIS